MLRMSEWPKYAPTQKPECTHNNLRFDRKTSWDEEAQRQSAFSLMMITCTDCEEVLWERAE